MLRKTFLSAGNVTGGHSQGNITQDVPLVTKQMAQDGGCPQQPRLPWWSAASAILAQRAQPARRLPQALDLPHRWWHRPKPSQKGAFQPSGSFLLLLLA